MITRFTSAIVLSRESHVPLYWFRRRWPRHAATRIPRFTTPLSSRANFVGIYAYKSFLTTELVNTSHGTWRELTSLISLVSSSQRLFLIFSFALISFTYAKIFSLQCFKFSRLMFLIALIIILKYHASLALFYDSISFRTTAAHRISWRRFNTRRLNFID
jgi:hypothetical protein